MSPVLRRTRGVLLRVIRRRALAIVLGLALAAPAAWVQLWATDAAWWLRGLGLICGATGLALFWTGLTGGGPDWVDEG